MGFPRYLKELHKDIINYYQNQPRKCKFNESKFWKIFGNRDYQYMWNYQIFLLTKFMQHKELKDIPSLYNSILDRQPLKVQKECFKIILKSIYKFRKNGIIDTSRERINFKWFFKIDDSNIDEPKLEYIDIKIDPKNYQTVLKINSLRQEKAIGIIEEREKIRKIKNTNYLRRTFPPKLRMFIFQRDKFQCQYCGITQSDCLENDINLEVHHIKEWEDGGKTNYSNGITCCSRCNKGLHYTKRLNTNLVNESVPFILSPFLYIIHCIIQL